MSKRLLWLLYLVFAVSVIHADVKITDIVVKPRWPWNGLVDITYSVVCKEKDEDNKFKDVYLDFTAIDGDRNQTISMKSLTGQGAKDPVKDGGPYTVTWDMAKDAPAFNSSAFNVRIHAIAGIAPYLVIDLQTWKKRYSSQPPNLDDDTCRTTELWLRQIPAGTFTMGCDSTEVGYTGYEFAKHQVTLTQMFYIGVFECTQKQWELVMGSNPSSYKGDSRPVECVSYKMIRGTGAQAGAGWPTYGHAVDSTSFIGKLQEKTGLTFDLPMEAQWEYACRAGTTTALNSGKNLTSTSSDGAMNEVGRYYYNQSDGKGGYSSGHTKVGSYLPNAWGLYDMHGNVWEWTLDWWGANTSSTAAETDPVGPNAGSYRVLRGGNWNNNAYDCRSAGRYDYNPSGNNYGYIGFRVLCLPLGR